MRFSINNMISFRLEARIPEDKEKKRTEPLTTMTDAFQKSTLKEILELDIQALHALNSIASLNKAVSRIPVINLQKPPLLISIESSGMTMSLFSKETDEKKRKAISKKSLDEASNLTNRILLFILKTLGNCELETKFTATFSDKSKTDTLNHLIDETRLDSAGKVGCRMSLVRTQFVFQDESNNLKQEYQIRYPQDEYTGERDTGQIEIQCEASGNGYQDGYDLKVIIDRLIEMTNKAVMILGV